MILEVLIDALLDCLKDLPFLFVAFLLLEALEHHASEKMNRALSNAGGFGPAVGAVLGCVPQCGFSIMASEFYSGGVITLGTLIAVFLSTSDEALIILISNPGYIREVGLIVLTKVLLGLIGGYLVFFLERWLAKRGKLPVKSKRGNIDHSECKEEKGILLSAVRRTAEVLLFLFIFTFALNLLLEVIGMESVSRLLLANTVFQPVLAALIGLIPNCASSVILTKLYVDGVISFGSVIAGLASAAGLGLLVLWRMNRNKKENLAITLLLLGIAIASGVLLQLFAG